MYLTPDLENMKNIQSLESLGQEKIAITYKGCQDPQ